MKSPLFSFDRSSRAARSTAVALIAALGAAGAGAAGAAPAAAATTTVSASASTASGSAAATATSTSSTSSTSTSTSTTSSSTSSTSTSTSASTSTSSTSTSTSTTSAAGCTMPLLSEPFAMWGDTNEYAFLPGTALDSFTGTGWKLSAGASITTTTLADGTSGLVLNLPVGGTAVSPAMCVDTDFPNARMIVRDATGTQGIKVLAAYEGGGAQVASSYAETGQGSGWALSPVLQTNPGNLSGWQLAVFTLVGTTATGVTQVSNFAIDPRLHR